MQLALPVERFAETTGLSKRTVFKAIHAGELPVVKPVIAGRDVHKHLILVSDGRAWLESFRTGGKNGRSSIKE